MLGVPADASHDELKAAYTAKALRLQQARNSDADAASWRMHELNDAWEVVRDPRRRQAYDAELAERAVAAVRAEAPPVAVGMEGLPEPERSMPEDAERRRSIGLWAPAVVIGLVLAAVIGAVSIAAAPEDEPDVVTTEVLPEGTCVRVTGKGIVAGEPRQSPEIIPVDCDGAEDAVIAAVVDLPLPCPPRTINVPLLDDDISLCLRS